jgi:hypothetical protein
MASLKKPAKDKKNENDTENNKGKHVIGRG